MNRRIPNVKMATFINRIKSNSDIGQYSILKQKRNAHVNSTTLGDKLIHDLDQVLTLRSAHRCHSLITIKPNEELQSVSSEELIHVSNENLNCSLKHPFMSTYMNSESAIQLKRTFPFISMVDKLHETESAPNTYNQDRDQDSGMDDHVELLLVDDIASELHQENTAFGFEEVDAPVFDLDFNSLDELCKLSGVPKCKPQ